jgi:hypothetical protein
MLGTLFDFSSFGSRTMLAFLDYHLLGRQTLVRDKTRLRPPDGRPLDPLAGDRNSLGSRPGYW